MLFLILATLLTWADDNPLPPGCGKANWGYTKKTRQYKQGDSDNLLDIYTPMGAQKPYKTIMLIHGGCFQGGERDSKDSEEFILPLVAAGFVVISPDYRKTDFEKRRNFYPTALIDVQDAYCWIQKNGAQYDLNVNQVVVQGYSAGATLAAYLATDHRVDGRAPPCSIRPYRLVDYFGRMNFKKKTETRPGLDCGEDFVGMERKFQNGEPQIEFTKADVMSNMNPRTVPPTLAIYGDADLAVDKSQTEEFCARLGSRCTPVKIKGADHMLKGEGELSKALSIECNYLKDQFPSEPVQMAEKLKGTPKESPRSDDAAR